MKHPMNCSIHGTKGHMFLAFLVIVLCSLGLSAKTPNKIQQSLQSESLSKDANVDYSANFSNASVRLNVYPEYDIFDIEVIAYNLGITDTLYLYFCNMKSLDTGTYSISDYNYASRNEYISSGCYYYYEDSNTGGESPSYVISNGKIWYLRSGTVEINGSENSIVVSASNSKGKTISIVCPIPTTKGVAIASDTCGDNLTWELTADSVLTISGTGTMTNYSSSSSSPALWYYNRSFIKSVVIEEGVTSIGNYAFNACSGLTSVEIPSSVTSIGAYAFNACSGLASVTIPNSVTSIGNYAFNACSGLTSVTLPNSVTSIGNSAFYGCTNLKTVYNNSNLNITLGSTAYGYVAYYATTLFKNGYPISKYAPASNKSIYDTDGDGEMEFISGAVLYNKNGEKVGDLPTLGTNSSYYSYYYFANFNNDAYIDIAPYTTTLGNYYINVNSSYNVLPVDLSNAPNKIYTNGYELLISHFQLDANLDGRMDFYSIEDVDKKNNPMGTHYFHLRQADGSYLKTQLTILTDTAAINSAMLELWESSSNSGLTPMYWSTMPSISDGWMHKMPKRNSKTDDSLQPLMMRRATAATDLAYADFTSIDTSIDLDRNGLLDLMSSKTGAVLYNLGNNRFLMGQFPGQVAVKDLNGDGIMDYIIYDAKNKVVTLQIYEGEGLFKTQTLMQNMAISDVWCYDFDNDGDVDILLPFDYTKTSGYAYLVFFRNDGNNTFKKVENAFDDPNWHFKFMDCKDVDNDGKYEIIAVDSVGEASKVSIYKGDYYLVRYNNKLKVSVDDTPFISNTITSSTSEPYFISGDYDNDGVLHYWTKYGAYYTASQFSSVTPNTAPAKMSRPRTILDAQRQMLNISWDRGSDAESSALDLEYSIRIGSAKVTITLPCRQLTQAD